MHSIASLTKKLQTVKDFHEPKASLEQYKTPPAIAAALLLEAHGQGDISGKRVLDLGCGTGILGIGSLELDAAFVEFLDLDPDALTVLRQNIASYPEDSYSVQLKALTARPADTVVMNPPFGTKHEHADRAFLIAAMESAPTIYSLHLASSEHFIEKLAADHGFAKTHAWHFSLPLKASHVWHTDASREVPVVAVRLAKL